MRSAAPVLGRISQTLPNRPAYLGLHPLVGDGMITLALGTDHPGVTRQVSTITCSYDIAGESGFIAMPMEIGVTYIGPEKVGVPAGTFNADHYHLQW